MHTHARLPSVSALLLFSCLSFAQAPAQVSPQVTRIRGPIEDSPSVTLEGSLNPHVRAAHTEDLGPLAADTPIHGITLVFKRSAEQENDLQQLLAQQTNPSSPLYHQWLTPAAFATRFGLAADDIAATETWLQSRGFTIDSVSPSRDRITFSGNAAQIHQAFGAELHRFRQLTGNTAEIHFAPATDLSLPPTLAPVTAAVLHLSDFRPKPGVRPLPQYTTLSTQAHFLAPGDLSGMYDLSNFLSSNKGVSPASIAIAGESFVNTGAGTSIGNFQASTGSGQAIIYPVIVPSSGNEAIRSGDEGESEIDLEYSSSLLRDGSVFFVYTGSSDNYDVFDALTFAIASDIAPVISISYGACEPLMSTTDLQQFNAVLEQAAAQGQTVVASSGDSGATACAPEDSSSGLSTAQQQQLAVDFPASSPYVTAVGGTQMAPGTFASGTTTYWAAATSNDNTDSLLSYVPEVAWNESSSAYGIVASGGGISSIFARPAWQTGLTGIPTGSYRLVPDIALQASVTSPGYVVCSDDPYIIGSVTDCTNGLKASNGTYVITGGTSFGAPIFAALIADLNRYEQSTGLGNINPVLYSLAAQPPVYASAFHDITSGTTACAIGDGNCGTPGTSGYAATTGYDMATGLGSVDFGNLVTAWPAVPIGSGVQTWLDVGGIPSTATAGASSAVTIEVDIPCTSGYCTTPPPSGSVYISVDGAAPVSAALVPPAIPQPLTASAAWNFVAPSTTGSHVIVVEYPGDANHLPSLSTSTVLVGNVVPSGTFTLSAQNTSLSNNTTGSTQITITPAGGYSGALTWSSSYTGGTSTTAASICYLVEPVSVNGPMTASMEIGVGTACDSPAAQRIPSPVQRSAVQPLRTPSHTAPVAGTFLALLFCGLLPSRRRKLLPILCVCALAVLGLTITGCGGGNSIGTNCGSNCGTNPGPQVYTITMTAKDSVNTSITASTSFTLTVSN